ncbi:MAG TPA: LysR family transcriptional regulator [Xanthomonadales bacterium]|nr:LysR family transcriptional regulator [Xanthomonadales bacterium]
MDRLFCMQVFVRVVENGAFVRAADSLGIARATATAAVVELESRLGVRLLNRTTRQVSMTDEGQLYYASCLRLLAEIDEAEDSLSIKRLAPRGRLRISIPQSFLDAVFYPALIDFCALYPELEVEIMLTDRGVNLVEEGVDCAIRGLELPQDSGLVSRVLQQVGWLTCAAPAYLEKHGTPQHPEELAQYNCIRFISQSTGRARDWLFSDGDATISVVPQGNVRLNSFAAAIQLAANGGGIAQVPDLLAQTEVKAGLLVPILADRVAAAPALQLVYPGNRYLTARVRAFVDYFLRVFRQSI